MTARSASLLATRRGKLLLHGDRDRPVLVAVTTAANAGVFEDKAGLAAGLLSASQQLGTALGLAIFSAIATARTSALRAANTRGEPTTQPSATPAARNQVPAPELAE